MPTNSLRTAGVYELRSSWTQVQRYGRPQLHAVLEGLTEAGFTIAVFDTTANGAAAPLVALAADICLLPMRPTRLDVEVTATTFSRCWPGEAQSRVPPQPLSAYPPKLANKRSSKDVMRPRSCGRTDNLRTNGFSGRHCCRLGRYRIRARRQGSTGNRGALALDSHPVSKHTE